MTHGEQLFTPALECTGGQRAVPRKACGGLENPRVGGSNPPQAITEFGCAPEHSEVSGGR